MVIDHAASVTFSFGSLLHCSSLPFLDKGHTNLLLFTCYWSRLRAGCTMPIFEHSLGFYLFYALVVFHEEGVLLLFLQVSVALVVGFAR